MTVSIRRPGRWLWLAAFTLLLCPSLIEAEPRPTVSATEELRGHLDRVLATAQSPSFRALDADTRRDKIRRLTAGLFNWSEISRRALGPEWGAKSTAERRGFATSFAGLVEAAYMGQLEQLAGRGFPPNAIRFLGESVQDGETTVRAMLRYPHDMPLDFVMSRRAARWEVHDVVVGGVSAAENYGAQFRRVMAKDSFAGLVERMGARANGAASPRAASPER